MFKSPENFIILILGLLWLFFLLRRLTTNLLARREKFAQLPMLERITGHKPTKRPLIKWVLLVTAFILMGIALSRPLGGSFEETLFGQGLDLVVTLDVSQSMQARDIEGHSRLQVAKALIEHLLGSLRQDRVGLIIFAGDTMVQSPLSHDKNTFLTFLERVDPTLLTKQGTNLSKAIETSIDRFDTKAPQTKVIVLVSDGEEQDSSKLDKALKEAKRKGIAIFTIGIGSKEGAPIPIFVDSFFGTVRYKTYKGRQVVSKLNDQTLRKIAKETQADFFRASDGKSAQNVAKKLNSLKRVAMVSQTQTVVSEWFSFPTLLAFLLLLVEWMISEKIPYEREKDHWLKRI